MFLILELVMFYYCVVHYNYCTSLVFLAVSELQLNLTIDFILWQKFICLVG